MSSKPLVSILIPAYNAGDWISETIRSALAQTWPHTEIIVVDDGSTDGTLAVARRFESAKVKVVAKANEGASATRNRAFSLSQGEYIQWLDADDVLSPNKIECQMLAAERVSKRVLLSSGWVYFHYRRKHKSIVPDALWQDLTPAEWLVRKMMYGLHMQTATWLTSRELSLAAGPWDIRFYVDDDGEYFCRVLLASEGVKFVPDAMTYYRMAGFASKSYIGTSRRKLEARLLSLRLHSQYLLSLEDSPRTRAACIACLNNWYEHFLPDTFSLVPQLKRLATKLGGTLKEPRLSWKYQWMRWILGWRAARGTQMLVRRIWWFGIVQSDKFLDTLDKLTSI